MTLVLAEVAKNIKNAAELQANYNRKQYKKYGEILGKHTPKTFAEFQEKKHCSNYIQAEDEEPMLEFGNVLVNQAEIKSLEILNE